MSLSRRDVDDLRPKVERTVEKFLGFSEPILSATALNCLSSGYDKKKTAEKLSSLLDSGKAEKLADKVLSILDGTRDSKSSRKRHHDNVDIVESKKVKNEKEIEKIEKKSDQLSASEIKDMMANAQKMIEERKKSLIAMKGGVVSKTVPSGTLSQTTVPAMQRATDDKAKKIALLQAQIKNKLTSGVLGGLLDGSTSGNQMDRPTPLILDSEGRTVDSTGKEVQLTHIVPTLKANIRAKKREQFRAQLQEKPAEEMSEAKFFDPRISARPNIRNRKSLRFNEPGKFQQMADRMRMKAQLQKLQGEISQIARKTGITSATKLAQIAPKVDSTSTDIPNIEWWDSIILAGDSYGQEGEDPVIKEDAITNLIEHPTQMRPPTEPLKPAFLPVYLTKKERRKLRRQNRREAWKEEQEKIRLGLEAPPEPKLRISNLMRVLGTEAVQDPTKIEAKVKADMAKRAKAHQEANQARKLTRDQRREKRRRTIQEDTTLGAHVAVYRVRDLSNMTKKFKVEMNCKQMYMTGAVIMFKDCNVIIVEGGPKQQNKYKRLMLTRIKWEEDTVTTGEGKEEPNKCILVWEGMVQQRNFGEMKFKICATEKLAREQLKKHGVEHYWDLAYSASVLETEEK
ncbi:hypothetical protein AAG570_002790 [Ranatra chinensis]|uniref:U4/U6 small nuclear ribonucleoprotein Prp3 n=1 Tax=Ranatra chinensis TaxID=642074 RepID=A0ABD0YTD1_9HEMI